MTIKECCDAYISKTAAASYVAEEAKKNPSLMDGEAGVVLLNALRLMEEEKIEFTSTIEAIAYKKDVEVKKENTAQPDSDEGTIAERLGILGR